MNCDVCKQDLDPIKGYFEIDMTEWMDANEGDSVKIVFHRGCKPEVIEELYRLGLE